MVVSGKSFLRQIRRMTIHHPAGPETQGKLAQKRKGKWLVSQQPPRRRTAGDGRAPNAQNPHSPLDVAAIPR